MMQIGPYIMIYFNLQKKSANMKVMISSNASLLYITIDLVLRILGMVQGFHIHISHVTSHQGRGKSNNLPKG